MFRRGDVDDDCDAGHVPVSLTYGHQTNGTIIRPFEDLVPGGTSEAAASNPRLRSGTARQSVATHSSEQGVDGDVRGEGGIVVGELPREQGDDLVYLGLRHSLG
jgi:hypothetical protein